MLAHDFTAQHLSPDAVQTLKDSGYALPVQCASEIPMVMRHHASVLWKTHAQRVVIAGAIACGRKAPQIRKLGSVK